MVVDVGNRNDGRGLLALVTPLVLGARRVQIIAILLFAFLSEIMYKVESIVDLPYESHISYP